MSAFLVSDDHITAICTFACRPGPYAGSRYANGYRYGIKPNDHGELFRLLKQANLDSLAARYGDPREVAEPRRGRLAVPPLEVVKAIECLEYQCNEVEGWEQTDAARTLDSIRRAAVRAIDGYDDAPWCIPPGAAYYYAATATA